MIEDGWSLWKMMDYEKKNIFQEMVDQT